MEDTEMMVAPWSEGRPWLSFDSVRVWGISRLILYHILPNIFVLGYGRKKAAARRRGPVQAKVLYRIDLPNKVTLIR